MNKAYLDKYLARKAAKYKVSDLCDLYASVPNENLRNILASLHSQLNHWFKVINSDLCTSYDEEGKKVYSGGYFHAQDSRDLLAVLNSYDELKGKLHSTPYDFKLINNNYDNAIRYCKKFLAETYGSTIPEDFKPIEIEDIEPIFIIKDSILVSTDTQTVFAALNFVGEGSYARVFVYKDPTYNIKIALKRAKQDLDDKELERFRQEFTVLKSLNSPYVVQVFAYDEGKNEYTMEYMDENIFKYISRCNSTLTLEKRKSAISQICHGLMYMHEKGILHRDISLVNVFVKRYDDVDVFKIGDFGLIKMPESSLTSTCSELKGSLNDPDLINVGFENYNMCHETYALTRLCFYILTGRTNMTKQKDGRIKQFWIKGTSTNPRERFQSVRELLSFVQTITEKNK